MTAVVVPHRNLALYFRAQVLERGLPLLGIHFLSPMQLRDHLFREHGLRMPLREHLRLLLAIAAEQCAPSAHDGPAVIADAIMRAPDHLLRAIDQLGAAGWNLSDTASAEVRAIVTLFEDLVGRCGFTLIHQADRTATSPHGRFNDLLIAGYDGAHWAQWPLLIAATKAAQRATVVLTDPRDEARELDATWIGSWEELFGAAVPIDAGEEQLSLFVPATIETTAPEFHFLVGRDTTEQAEAIASLTQQFLADKSSARIGLLFPEAGALPRLVAAALARADIPHNDTIAHLAPGPFEDEAWTAWLDLQNRQRVNSVVAFVRADSGALAVFGGLTSDRIDHLLRRALDDILIDDLKVLQALLRLRARQPDALLAADGLAQLRVLPASATLPEFLRGTGEIFAQLGWHDRWTEVQRLSGCWNAAVDVPFQRGTYLRWLGEIGSSFARLRDEIGNHPYSRVQLLFYPQAVEQRWSHLIFCGLNEGAWPVRVASGAFVDDDELAKLNRRARELNRRALRQGKQGEGHTTVRKGTALCLGGNEQREIAARQFSALVESAETGVGVAANLFGESAPDRAANPSEFFTRLYYSGRGEALSQQIFETLQQITQQRLQSERSGESPMKCDGDVRQTRVAYDHRRAARAAGEYEFALREPLARKATVSATGWEKAIKDPALVWLKTYLAVEPPDNAARSPTATGQWVHRWLAAVSDAAGEPKFTALPPAPELCKIVRTNAQEFRSTASSLVTKTGRALPDWWISGWMNAAYLADNFAAKLSGLSGWDELATEWRLHEAKITLADGAHLSFSGRADLILARGETGTANRELWVVDYKTGTRKTLRPSRCDSDDELSEKLGKKLRCGEGIQLALYALALREAGASAVAISLLSPNLLLDRPQLRTEELLAQEAFWRELARMQATGIFGMRGSLRSRFNFTPAYPLATLAVDPDLLEAKWGMTHPAFAPNAEEPEE